MIRKTALLTGVASALMFAAPAFAQDMTQDPATDPMAQPPAAESEATAEQSGSVAPGAQVTSSDGASLGVLEGAGVDAWASTPDELRLFQEAETRKWGQIIKAAGIEPE